MGNLNGKVAVITGGTRGLGLGIARAFAEEGAAVVVASRSQPSVDTAVQAMRSAGGQAGGLAVDVGSLEQVEELASYTIQQFGRLDIWVNNAGLAGPYGPTLGIATRDFYQVTHTNIIGTYNGSRTALRHFTAQRSGKLINVLGDGYSKPLPWQTPYGASKSWVYSFTMALAEETKASGVGVYAFAPGLVLTDLITHVEVIAGSEGRMKVFPTIVRMFAKPPEVAAQKAVWIASAATDGKTGMVIRASSLGRMLRGALKEGLRILMKKPAPDLGFEIHVIPSDSETSHPTSLDT